MNRKHIIKVVVRVVALSLVVCVVPAAILTLDGLHDDIHQADLAVVLGNKVEPNGQPSARLQARLDKTIELYQQGMFPNIIVSGGVGIEGFDEAKVMKQYLVAHGLPEKNIFLDSNGNTTYLTAQNTARIMKDKGWQSAMVISQYFHIPRTKLALHRLHVEKVYSAHADFFELRDFYSTAREVVGYASYFLRN
jgi:vancomycin permeability regulator SanA